MELIEDTAVSKLDKIKVAGTDYGEETFNSKAATGNQLVARNVAKGITAGQLVYKGNDRKYGAYGVMNETDFDFNTSFLKDVDHQLKVGFKYHKDHHNRDQQKHNFTQAVGGAITAHADGVTFSDDRHEKTEGYAVYAEEKARINNFELSLGGRFEYIKFHYRHKLFHIIIYSTTYVTCANNKYFFFFKCFARIFLPGINSS